MENIWWTSMEALNYNPSHPPSFFAWEEREGKMRVSESIRNCVVFIGMVNPDNDFIAHGTGFIITIFLEGVAFNYIVTCKHVLDQINGNEVCIRINLIGEGADLVKLSKNEWIMDQKHDIAVLSKYLSASIYDLRTVIEENFATKDKIKELNIMPGESVFLVGLFISHYGAQRNMPIIRVGNIAAIPTDPILTSSGYLKDGYLVEMRSIGGFSGSPVFVRILPCRIIDNVMTFGSDIMSLLLGMMQGLYTVKPEAYPGESEADAMNAGIGIVIPIEAIMKTINGPLLLEQREKTLKQIKKQSGVRSAAAKPIPDTENPQHKEDFNSLVSPASKTKLPDD